MLAEQDRRFSGGVLLEERGSVVAIIALVAACSGNSTTEFGFISLGRDNGDGGVVGAAGFAPTGGTDASGGTAIGTGGSMPIFGGTGGQGGTSTGAAPSCGSGGMPAVYDPSAGGSEIIDACELAGPNHRICLGDESVWYCTENYGGIVEQCAPGTCATGCCHATADPCPVEGAGVYDCAGDCGGYGSCTGAQVVSVTLGEDDMQVVRVGGPNMFESECGQYVDLSIAGPAPGNGARVTVSPPWILSRGCPRPEDGQCLVTQFTSEVVVVSTNVEAPPPRNVIIETSQLGSTCP